MRTTHCGLPAAAIAVLGFWGCAAALAADQPPTEQTPTGTVFSEQPVAPTVVGRALSPVATDSRDVAGSSVVSDTPAPAPERSNARRSPPPFGGPAGRSALHERLRARRLARIQQMRQTAEQNGDTQGVERAQYLEGMVNELHDQGLFSFAQKVVGAIQEGKLQGAAAGSGASAGAVEMPNAELGAPAPLPDADLGEAAPLPESTDNPPPGNE